MRIVIMSRKEIEAEKCFGSMPEQAVAICIAYPNGRLHRVEPVGNLLAVHHLRFSDCDENGSWCFPGSKDVENKPIPMTRGQAIDILDFVEQWRSEIDTIFIACYGGISRSAGIGAGLAAIYGWEDKYIYEQRIPNAHCKSLLIREGRKA